MIKAIWEFLQNVCLPEKVCLQCGSTNLHSAKRCWNCGQKPESGKTVQVLCVRVVCKWNNAGVCVRSKVIISAHGECESEEERK